MSRNSSTWVPPTYRYWRNCFNWIWTSKGNYCLLVRNWRTGKKTWSCQKLTVLNTANLQLAQQLVYFSLHWLVIHFIIFSVQYSCGSLRLFHEIGSIMFHVISYDTKHLLLKWLVTPNYQIVIAFHDIHPCGQNPHFYKPLTFKDVCANCLCATLVTRAAGNTTVICHASLHILITIDWSWRQTWRRKRCGKKSHFTPLDHRLPLFF